MNLPRDNWSRLGVLEPLAVRTCRGVFETYVTRPLAEHGASCVILLPGEVRAQTESRQLAEQFAFDGFLALAPDLTHRLPSVRPMRGSGSDLCRMGWDLSGALTDLHALADLARRIQGGSGRVGAVGWGAGGLLAYSLAAQGAVDAGVVYAESDIEAVLHGADLVAHPLLVHLGSDAVELERRYDDHQWIEMECDLDVAPAKAPGWRCEALPDAMTRRFLHRRLRAH